MARYPGAIWRPITAPKGRKRLTLYNRMNLHVAVSEAASLHGFFNRTGRVDSHFYVRKDGTVEQYVDTSMRAFADLQGNDATISVETQGGVKNPNGEPWTAAQIKALASLFAWAAKTHGIPMRLATSSKPGAPSRGLSWHRLGIDGNFPKTGILRGRNQRGGGMKYSNAFGKICPGDAKIRQIPAVLDLAKLALKPSPAKPRPEGVLGMSKHAKFNHTKKQTLSANKKYRILRIADGRSYIVAGPSKFTGQINIVFDDLAPDQTAMVRVFRGGYKKGASPTVASGRTIAQQEIVGTTGKTFAAIPFTGAINENYGNGRDTRLYVQAKLNSGPERPLTISTVQIEALHD